MKRSTSLNSGFSIIVGVFLLIEGIWGLSDDIVFGILTTNETHATMHIILGLLGIFLGISQKAKEYCIALGLLLLIVSALHFIKGADEIILKLLNVNNNVAYLNIFIGLAAIASTFRKTEKIVDQIPDTDEDDDDEIIADRKPSGKLTITSANPNKELHKKQSAQPITRLKTIHPDKNETSTSVQSSDKAPIKLETLSKKKKPAVEGNDKTSAINSTKKPKAGPQKNNTA